MLRANGGGACPGTRVTACCSVWETHTGGAGLAEDAGAEDLCWSLRATFVTRDITRG